jgi:drug/metabolite transporter (DMT)-like permease
VTVSARHSAFGAALVSAALFGVATPFSKTLLAGLQANQLAGLLYLGAALFLAPHLAHNILNKTPIFPADARNRRNLLGAVFFGGILGPVLMLLGLKMAMAASVSMWLNLETVATAVFAVLIFEEHLGKFAWIGNSGVLLCGLLLSFNEGWSGFAAMALMVGAAICWGLDNNFTAVIDTISPQVSTFWKGLIAGGTNFAIALALVGAPQTRLALPALLLGGASYGVSISLYIAAAQRMGAARSQMIFASSPFFGVLFSVLWLGESISILQAIAAIILTGSIVLLYFDRHEHTHLHAEMEHEHEHRHDEPHHQHQHPDGAHLLRHSHMHRHAPLRHTHPHWPDLHHRHPH